MINDQYILDNKELEIQITFSKRVFLGFWNKYYLKVLVGI